MIKIWNPEPIWIDKIIESRKLIDYFGLSIKANPPRVGKKNVYSVYIGYIPIPSYVNPHIENYQMEKELNLDPPKLRLYQLIKNISADISPNISSALRDLGLIFIKFILCVCTKFSDAEPSVNLDSWSGGNIYRVDTGKIIWRSLRYC